MKKAERFQVLSEMGCIVCWLAGFPETPAEIHHLRAGVHGTGMRSGYDRTIPLCPAHHRTGGHGVAIHAGRETFENNYGTENELLEFTNRGIVVISERKNIPKKGERK
jgi:hypothetical protein